MLTLLHVSASGSIVRAAASYHRAERINRDNISLQSPDQYTGPACSAKVHFIVVGNITNPVNKVCRLGQWTVYF